MRYWYDTEFVENGSTIDLISIGIVAEDGREYYAQSLRMNFKQCSDWIVRNVLLHLTDFDMGKQIPIGEKPGTDIYHNDWSRTSWRDIEGLRKDLKSFLDPKMYDKPELWGYYSAYDHVALCQLFGTMMQLPEGWPMYTRDIKQWCDQLGNPKLPEQGKGEHHALADARWNKVAWEFLKELEGS